MVKLYQKIEGEFLYHEAWVNDGLVIEHWGEVGDEGDTNEVMIKPGETDESAIERVLSEARESGFTEIPASQHESLWIEYDLDNWGNSDDLKVRSKIEFELDQCLGWTGLGRSDGASIGSGSMDISFQVVDFRLAKKTIEAHLKGGEFANYSRIWQVH